MRAWRQSTEREGLFFVGNEDGTRFFLRMHDGCRLTIRVSTDTSTMLIKHLRREKGFKDMSSAFKYAELWIWLRLGI